MCTTSETWQNPKKYPLMFPLIIINEYHVSGCDCLCNDKAVYRAQCHYSNDNNLVLLIWITTGEEYFLHNIENIKTNHDI